MLSFRFLECIVKIMVYTCIFIDYATCTDDVKIDLVFVLDASSSVTEGNFQLVKDFIKELLRDADIAYGNARVGVVVYSDTDHVQFHLKNYSKEVDVSNAIDNIPYLRGNSNTAGALKTMRTVMFTKENGDRDGVDNVAVLITGGLSNVNSKRTILEAEQARDEGVHIYAIGIGLTDSKEIDVLASRPLYEHRFSIGNFSELMNLRQKVWKSFAIGCVKAKLDLVFVLDVSTSNVAVKTFLQMIDFVKNFLHDADIDGDNVLVGVVTNRADSSVHFQLNDFTTKNEVLNALDSTPFCYVCNGIMNSIKIMKSVMFSEDNGDRPRVENVAVVITHSVSHLHHKSDTDETEQSSDEDISMYAIGVGLVDIKVLDGIASHPIHKHRFSAKTLAELTDLRHTIVSAPCFFDTALDLVFILDSSNSIRKRDFRLMKDFVKDILTDADIDGGKVRVGVVIYGKGVDLQFHLNDHYKKKDLRDAIDGIQHSAGLYTDTGKALRFMRTDMFTPENGDRPEVQNVAFVMTDGMSQEGEITVYQAEQARAHGIHIIAVGINLASTHELDSIASQPLEENRFSIENFEALMDLRQIILQTLLYITNEKMNTVDEFDKLAAKCNLIENEKVDNTKCVYSEISNFVSKVNMAKEEEFTRTLTKASNVIKKLVNTTLIHPEDVANHIVETVETMWIRILEKDFCVDNSTFLQRVIATAVRETSSEVESCQGVRLDTSVAISAVVSLNNKIVFQGLKADRRTKYISIVKDTIAVEIGTALKDIQYPNYKTNQTNSSLPDHWINRNKILLSQDCFDGNNSNIKYSIVVIRNTNSFWKVKSIANNSVESTTLEIVSDILALTLDVNLTTTTGSPVQLTFGVSKLETSHKDPVCVFLKELTGLNGIWSSEGCGVDSITDDQIICTCDHLTTFAVVASPLKASNYKVLTSWIIAGCIVSTVCQAVTVFVYLFLWRYIRSERSILLVNKSVCMLITYLIFVAGIDNTEDPISCKIVAICIHYCFLTVFCNFLSQSLALYTSLRSMTEKTRLKYFLTFTYLCPLIIVSITLAVYKTEGYGSEKYCWLSLGGSLFWSFLGPIVTVICVNSLVLLTIVCMSRRQSETEGQKQAVRTLSVVGSIVILTVFFGLTWVIGHLSIANEDAVFQYLFVILNLLQGVIIFVILGLNHQQARETF